VQKGDVDLIKKHNLIGFELYNLKDDPSQSRDLASSEPERLQILAKQLIEKYTEIRSEGKRWSD
jgi:arylsulfatase A-like enzyme